MTQDILAVGIVFAAFGWTLYSLVRLFVSKGKSKKSDCGCGNASCTRSILKRDT